MIKQNNGDRLVAEGTPEEVARREGSHTGMFLKPVLGRLPRAEQRKTG